jgi:large subunit ribosomal protein L17
MRHRTKRHKLGRTSAHRKRTLAALSNALIEHKHIKTTIAKAKAIRPFVEPLITRAKTDSEHNRRQVFRYLQDKKAVTTLFDEVAERVGDRPGGYVRIIKLGQRNNDGSEMALVELVDYNDVQPASTGGSGSGGGTRRGSGKGRRDKDDA